MNLYFTYSDYIYIYFLRLYPLQNISRTMATASEDPGATNTTSPSEMMSNLSLDVNSPNPSEPKEEKKAYPKI